MNRIPFFIVPVLGLLITLTAQAASPNSGRIDLIGRQSADFEVTKQPEGGSASPAYWANNNTEKNVTIEFSTSSNWQQKTFTILPKTSGRLLFLLTGPHVVVNPATKELTPVFIHFDDFKVEGAILKNGSFEKTDRTENPADWNENSVSTSNPPIDDKLRAGISHEGPQDGKNFVRVWHNSRYIQAIDMEQGVPVTVSFWTRSESK